MAARKKSAWLGGLAASKRRADPGTHPLHAAGALMGSETLWGEILSSAMHPDLLLTSGTSLLPGQPPLPAARLVGLRWL